MQFLAVVSSVLIASIAAQNPLNDDCEKNLATSPSNCCKNIPSFFAQKVIDKCRADFNKNGLPTPCFAECITNATSILKAGQFQKDQAITVMQAGIDAVWKPVVKKAIETCDSEFKRYQPAMPQQVPSIPQLNQCSLISGAMLVCIRTNIFIGCPNYGTDKNCTKLKEQIPECPIALINRSP